MKRRSQPDGLHHDLRTAVAAQVHERLAPNRRSGGRKHGHAGQIVGDEVARVGELALMGDHQGRVAQDLVLGGEMPGVGVDLDRVVEQGLRHGRGPLAR